MEITCFDVYNPDSRMKVSPIDLVSTNLRSVNMLLKYIKQMNPEIEKPFLSKYSELLKDNEEIGNFDTTHLDRESIRKSSDLMETYPLVVETIIQKSFEFLNPPEYYPLNSSEIEVPTLDYLRALMIPKFHRVKALTEVLGRKEGIDLWKKIIFAAIKDSLKNSSTELRKATDEAIKSWRDHGSSGNCTSNFRLIVFDEYKFMLKVTKCGVHEVTKHLNDPELAYLSYCWTGRPEDELNTMNLRRRTTQTLHLADFCDEFFWDQRVHDNPSQPTLEFLESIE